MRVAIIASPHVPVPPEKYGGTERVIYYLIKGLLEEGHEPILFGPGDSKVACELVPTVEEAVPFPIKASESAGYSKRVAEINKNTEKLIRKRLNSIDIIHSQGVDLINFRNFPNLTTMHGALNFTVLHQYLERKDLYYASISNNQQKTCPELNYVGVVYNGLDPNEFPVVLKPKKYVCFLGRFDHEKGPHLAIQLAISLGVPIKLAGKIDYQGEEYFRHEIEPYLKHPLVEYLGELGFSEKTKLLSNAICNLHPVSFREPFGLTVLEAAYCGTPTIATNRGSMPEIIEEGRTGVLVEDFVEGYFQLEKCIEMDRHYIASRARMLFNYLTMSRDYLKAYRSVIDEFNNSTKSTAEKIQELVSQPKNL